MEEMSVTTFVASLGFLLGCVLGGTARYAHFCTLGAIADVYVSGDTRRLRSWGLAIAVATLLTQAMDLAGLIDLRAAIYLTPDFGWLGAILGGLLFGFGTALVGTCGYGTLVRLGGGDLRSLVVFLVFGITAYMTLRGLTGVGRVAAIEPTNLDLAPLGGQALQDLLGWVTGIEADALHGFAAAAVVAFLFLACFSSPVFRRAPRYIIGGAVIGLVVAAGWFVTGVIGYDDFEPTPLESLTFATPLGEALVYLMTFSGSTINFGIGVVGGVLVGSWLASLARREFRFEAFDDAKEMLRHLLGGALMGVGGVLALGCTIGQGITGMSTLSLSAPLALLSIFAGAGLGLRYLEEGSLSQAVKLFFQRG